MQAGVKLLSSTTDHQPFWCMFVCAFVINVPSSHIQSCMCVLCQRNVHLHQQKRWGGKKTINQAPPLALLPRWYRFYQWAKVSVSMETLMNEEGPGNPGDRVNEELPHRLNWVTEDAFQKLRCHHILVILIIFTSSSLSSSLGSSKLSGLSCIKGNITLHLDRKSLKCCFFVSNFLSNSYIHA